MSLLSSITHGKIEVSVDLTSTDLGLNGNDCAMFYLMTVTDPVE